jgi:putative transcriptional regulator
MRNDLARGKILVAMPTLLDPNFRQSVVLLCEHGPEGSMGLVVNRPTEVEVSALADEYPVLSGAGRIYSGGPVARNTMIVLCRGGDVHDGFNILENVYLAKDLAVLENAHYWEGQRDIRCFLGYAGWAPGQLEAEMNASAWSLMVSEPRFLFDDDPELLWQEMMRRLGGDWAPYAEMPPDPSAN